MVGRAPLMARLSHVPLANAESPGENGNRLMPRYVAFLRGINLGKRRLAMSRLRSLVKDIGLTEVETFIASGNVVFSTSEVETVVLESSIRQHLERSLGYEVETFVRTLDEVAQIARKPVFPQDGQTEVRIHVAFHHRPLSAETAAVLHGIRTGYDEFRVHQREFYWLCHGGISDSKVWELPEVKSLKLPISTMRNISTLRRLVAKFLPADD